MTCRVDSPGAAVDLTILDATDGTVVSTLHYADNTPKSYDTPYGTVTWQDANDVGRCGSTYNHHYDTALGFVSISNGNQVPAELHFAVDPVKLTLIGDVQQASGFAAPEQNTITWVGYAPNGDVWWADQTGGTVTVHQGPAGPTKDFVIGDQLNSVWGIEFSTSGKWAVHINLTGGEDWYDSSGQVLDGDPLYNNATLGLLDPDSLAELLPNTQYQLGGGIQSADGKSVAFFAFPNGGNNGDPADLFTVPATGGNPTLVASSIPSGQFLYYGHLS